MLLSPLSQTLNPATLSSLQWISQNHLFFPTSKTQTLTLISPPKPKNLSIQAINPNPNFPSTLTNNPHRPKTSISAGRSKKKPGQPSTGRIEGGSDIRREAKRNARRRSLKLAESLFYRLKNPHKTQADNFTEDELQMIGMGYDRMVRFMEKDDPNLKHPYDWYKYGEFGPYSWRGIVVGDPIRGRFCDERVSMIGEVKNHEEWEEIEKYDMAQEFGNRVNALDKTLGFRYFWVFVRHPRWRVSELPWQQWTLISEVVVEGGNKRLDKWSLMGRFGNKVRAMITQCAAWMRPDIIYVKRPVYQCRFEPQEDFFKTLGPLLDPDTEGNYLFELKREDGRVEMCTYFGGLCKIVKVNPKAFVDDVVKGYEKLDDEKKSRCLEFLLTNHPNELLHPYTKEWKAKLEEMELGCDAPDDDDDENFRRTQMGDWNEEEEEDDDYEDEDEDEDGDDDEEEDDDYEEENEDEAEYEENDSASDEDDDESVVVDIDSEKEELGMKEEIDPEENEKYWEEEFQKAFKSSEAMEGLVKRSLEASSKLYKNQIEAMQKAKEQFDKEGIEENTEVIVGSSEERIRPKVYKDEWKYVGFGRKRRRRVKKNRVPPELFLRAAVRPFTYKNLVKEIVLLRHAIIDGEVSSKV